MNLHGPQTHTPPLITRYRADLAVRKKREAVSVIRLACEGELIQKE